MCTRGVKNVVAVSLGRTHHPRRYDATDDSRHTTFQSSISGLRGCGRVRRLEQFLVAVPDGDFGDAGDLADLVLGDLLVGQQGGGIDRGGREADRRLAAVDAFLTSRLEQLRAIRSVSSERSRSLTNRGT